jgi:hypothetical protein
VGSVFFELPARDTDCARIQMAACGKHWCPMQKGFPCFSDVSQAGDRSVRLFLRHAQGHGLTVWIDRRPGLALRRCQDRH